MQNPLIRKAIRLSGSQKKLASAIKHSQTSISYYLNGGGISAEVAIKIEKATGISRAEIRPDIFT